MKKASDEAQQQISTFSSDVISGLLSVLSHFNVRTIPMPSKFKQILLQIASYEFLRKPSAALTIMNSGVPEERKPFWEGLGIATLFSIYQAQSASTSTVLKMVEGAMGEILMKSVFWVTSDNLLVTWVPTPYETSYDS